MFTGLSSTIVREMPGYFFFFGGYEATRELLTVAGQNRDEIGWQKTMVAGAVGGTVLWLVIFPADVVKSRIQVRRSPFLMKKHTRNIALKRKMSFLSESGTKFKDARVHSLQEYRKARRYWCVIQRFDTNFNKDDTSNCHIVCNC